MGPYEIVEPLGKGGMGDVYRARDLRLGRDVAVKLLNERWEDTAGTERLLREARAASRLTHPNIVAIYDIGNESGSSFIVMELVHGKTLRQSIPPKGVPVETALRWGRQIASALAKAHAAGIVHRDLKPANVMVTEDGAIQDHGFRPGQAARRRDWRIRERSIRRLQRLAIVAGAIAGNCRPYMSPEQAEGKSVDARSDIFTLGLLEVFDEMLAGRRAFQAESTVATLAAIIHTEPKPPLREAAPHTPEDIRTHSERLPAEIHGHTVPEHGRSLPGLGTCDPARARHQDDHSGATIRNDSFDRRAPLYQYWRRQGERVFQRRAGRRDYHRAGQAQHLKIIARTSSFVFKDRQEDVRRIGELLGVAHILEGSVRRAGSRIRVSVQLVRVSDGGQAAVRAIRPANG